jgi:branched-chain amino acid transport system ATP-binding protein
VTGALLRTRDLEKRFGGLVAVNDVSIDIKRGEVLSIIGPNGAGKTTLFNLLTGFFEPSSGAAELYNDDRWVRTTGRSPNWIVTQGLVRTFQQALPFGELTVRENVLVAMGQKHYRSPRMFGRYDREAHVNRADELLERVDLGAFAETPGQDLPLALQRRLEIARALALNPELLLLDEPAAGLNEDESEDLLAVLTDLNAEGLTIGLVSHTMQLVMNVSDRIYVLHQGSVIAEGAPTEIQNDRRVAEAYLGERSDA